MMQKVLEWILSGGYAIITAVVFVETGLLVGFCLPGDSLLFTAGLACVPGNQLTSTLNLQHFDLLTMNLCLIPAAIIGDTLGYWIGFKAGQKMYQREKTFFFRRDHLLHTKAYYDKHGGKTIFLARFLPIARTFAPVVAGIAQMPYRRFIAYNIFGGIAWVSGLSVAGYYLGQIEIIRRNLEATIIVIIFISVLPVVFSYLKARNVPKPVPPAPADVAADGE